MKEDNTIEVKGIKYTLTSSQILVKISLIDKKKKENKLIGNLIHIPGGFKVYTPIGGYLGITETIEESILLLV